MQHIASIADVHEPALEHIIRLADYYKTLHHQGGSALYQERGMRAAGCIMASLFYEPSTRTRLSFESAMHRLGGAVIGTENAHEFSSTIKGESLEDSIRVIGNYADVIVLRHNEVGAAAQAATVSPVPIINAGDGTGEHPTQALLDYFTIWDTFPHRRELTLAVVGDLKNGRTIQSLVRLIIKMRGTTLERVKSIQCIAPVSLQLPEVFLNEIRAAGITVTVHSSLAEAPLEHSDVVYMTRTQTERGSFMDDVAEKFVLDTEPVQRLSTESVILHPLPRNAELPVTTDTLTQARYFEQAQNGLFLRMALLSTVLPKHT